MADGISQTTEDAIVNAYAERLATSDDPQSWRSKPRLGLHCGSAGTAPTTT